MRVELSVVPPELHTHFHSVKTQGEVSNLQPERGPLPGPNHAGTLIWAFQLQNFLRNKFLLFILFLYFDNQRYFLIFYCKFLLFISYIVCGSF